MEILACPIDKQYPLKLFALEEKNGEVETGIMICPKCKRWYPIQDGIPTLLPDQLRDADKDQAFLVKYDVNLTNIHSRKSGE